VPFTPFHIGPALLLKPSLRDRFSLGTFALVQVAIDLEVAANILTDAPYLHTRLHTLAGALAMGVLCIIPAKIVLTGLYGALSRRLEPHQDTPAWLIRELRPVTWIGAVSGGLIGGISHALLDSLIHVDARIFAPWVKDNPLWIPGSFIWIHLLCAAFGLVGLWFWSRSSRIPE